MTNRKSTPFKSGVYDFDELHKRYIEIGQRKPPIGSENGVDVTPKPETPVLPADYYGPFY